MSSADDAAPRLLAQFRKLSPDQRAEFMVMLGKESNAELFSKGLHALPVTEFVRLIDPMVSDAMKGTIVTFSMIVVEALRAKGIEAPEELITLALKDHDRETAKIQEGMRLREKYFLKKERDPKPRKTSRDDEIVRLREAESKSFGEIGRLLMQKNADWCGKDGKPLNREAVEKAYLRRKRKPTN